MEVVLRRRAFLLEEILVDDLHLLANRLRDAHLTLEIINFRINEFILNVIY
jgi:hypothetical protein